MATIDSLYQILKYCTPEKREEIRLVSKDTNYAYCCYYRTTTFFRKLSLEINLEPNSLNFALIRYPEFFYQTPNQRLPRFFVELREYEPDGTFLRFECAYNDAEKLANYLIFNLMSRSLIKLSTIQVNGTTASLTKFIKWVFFLDDLTQQKT